MEDTQRISSYAELLLGEDNEAGPSSSSSPHTPDAFAATATRKATTAAAAVAASAHGKRKRRRGGGQRATELLRGVLGEADEDADGTGGAREEDEEEEERSGHGVTRLGRRKITLKALAALLAAQPRTLRQDPDGTASDLHGDDEDGAEDTAADEQQLLQRQGLPLLEPEGESGESGGRTDLSRSQGWRSGAESEGPEESESPRQSISPQTITAAPVATGRRKKMTTATAATASGRKAGKRLGALAIPARPAATKSFIASEDTTRLEEEEGGRVESTVEKEKEVGWAALLRQHGRDVGATKSTLASSPQVTTPAVTATSTPSSSSSSSRPKKGSGALSKARASLAGPAASTGELARERTEAFRETPPPPAEGPSTGGTSKSVPDSPDLVPPSHLRPTVVATGAASAKAEAEAALLTPALLPRANSGLLGTSPASGSSPGTLDIAQTLAVLDLSLRPGEPEEGESPSGDGASAGIGEWNAGGREAPREGLPETVDDGLFKGEGVGLLDANDDDEEDDNDEERECKEHEGNAQRAVAERAGAATGSKVGGDEEGPDGDASDSEETPLFAAVAPRAPLSHDAAGPPPPHDGAAPAKDLTGKKADCDERGMATPLPALGKGTKDTSRRSNRRGSAAETAISVSTTPEPRAANAAANAGKQKPPQQPQHHPLLEAGVRVQARWGGLWCDAVTTEAEKNGYVQIRWDEDGALLHVKVRDVRPHSSGAGDARDGTEPSSRLKREDCRPHKDGGAAKSNDAGRLARAEDEASEDATTLGSHGKGTVAINVAAEAHEERSEADDDDVLMAEPPADASATKHPHKAKRPRDGKAAEHAMQTDAAAAAAQQLHATKRRRTTSSSQVAARITDERVVDGNRQETSHRDARQAAKVPADSQGPLLTGTSPDKQQPMFVATQNIFEGPPDSGGVGRGSDDGQTSPSVVQHEERKGRHPRHIAAHVRRRLAASVTPTPLPAPSDVAAAPPRPASSSDPPLLPRRTARESEDGGTSAAPPEERGLAQQQPPPQPLYPLVSLGEDYYFRMPLNAAAPPTSMPTTGSPRAPPLAPAVLLGRVVGVEEGGFAAADTGPHATVTAAEPPVQRRVALQVYEMKHVTMRQNPRTGELEQQTTVYPGPRQAIVPVSALLFDVPVFVLSPDALRHVYLLEESAEARVGGGGGASPAHVGLGETQRMDAGEGRRGRRMSGPPSSRSSPSSSMSSTESFHHHHGSDWGGGDGNGEEEDDLPQGVRSPQGSPHRRTAVPSADVLGPRQAPPHQQVYDSTFPLPTPTHRHLRQSHGIHLSLPLAPRSGSVLEEVVVGDGRAVREGMIVAFHNPHLTWSRVLHAQSAASAATPLSSPNKPCSSSPLQTGERATATSDGDARGHTAADAPRRQRDGADEEDRVLFGKVQMLRQVNGGAVLVVHTMAHNSVFGGSKMYVITPDMILDVS